MSKRREVTVPAKLLGLIILAISKIQGDRPVMLSWRLGEIIDTTQTLQKAFIERLQAYVVDDPENPGLREDLTEEDRAHVDEILGEEITFEVPLIRLPELEEAGLTVPDDSILRFLYDQGILSK